MTLKDLEPGDRFHAASDKKGKVRYIVYGNPSFSRRHGSTVCNCVQEGTGGSIVSKSCRLEIIQLPASSKKELIMEKFKPKGKEAK